MAGFSITARGRVCSTVVALVALVALTGCADPAVNGLESSAAQSARGPASPCGLTGESWVRVLGDPSAVGPKAEGLIEHARFVRAAGFDSPPRVVLSGPWLQKYARMIANERYQDPMQTELRSALEELGMRNPFAHPSDGWPYVLRPSDWARGVGMGPRSRFVPMAEVEKQIVSLGLQIIQFYERSAAWNGKYSTLPGLIVEPLIGRLVDGDSHVGPHWITPSAGIAYGDRPGPDWGSYIAVGTGVGGGVRHGQTWRLTELEQSSTEQLANPVGERRGDAVMQDVSGMLLQEVSLRTGVNRIRRGDLRDALFPRLAEITRQLGPVYLEWAMADNDPYPSSTPPRIWVTQLAKNDEGSAVFDPEAAGVAGAQMMEVTRNVLGTGTTHVQALVLLRSSLDAQAYASRAIDTASAQRFSEVQRRPHVVVVPSVLMRTLQQMLDEYHVLHRDPMGLVAVMEVTDGAGAHVSPTDDHVASGFISLGGFLGTISTTDTWFSSAFEFTGPITEAVTPSRWVLNPVVLAGEWLLAAHQREGWLRLYESSDAL